MILNNEQIVSYLNQLDKESKAIQEEILRLVWAMRGSVQFDDGMLLSDLQRSIITKIFNENMETANKTRMPFF